MNTVMRSLVIGSAITAGVAGGGALAFAQPAVPTVSPTVPTDTTAPPETTVPTETTVSTPSTTVPTPTPADAPAGITTDDATTAEPAATPDAVAPRFDLRALRGSPQAKWLTNAVLRDMATALGVTTDRLRDAEKVAVAAVKDQVGKPPKRSGDADRQERRDAARKFVAHALEVHDATLATELGVSVEQVTTARHSVVHTFVDRIVGSGLVSREKADRFLASLKDGTLPDLARSFLGPRTR